MMKVEQIAQELVERVQDLEGFERRYGKHAAAMVVHVPELLRLFNKLTFDLVVPLAARQLTAMSVVYLAEPQNYLGQDHRAGAEGLIDDTWLLYRVLERISRGVDEAALRRHWRSQTDIAEVLGFAHNVDTIEQQVPSRVLTMLRQYLGEPNAD